MATDDPGRLPRKMETSEAATEPTGAIVEEAADGLGSLSTEDSSGDPYGDRKGETLLQDEAADGPAYQFVKAPPALDEEWCRWLRDELQACPAYADHAALLDECCQVAGRWRARFWHDRALWSRIRRGGRLAKELSEIAPVLARTRAEVAALPADSKELVIMDLCSGFGYLGMFLSELLPPHRVDKIVLVDRQWAPHNVELQAHHLSTDHVLADGWPIRLTTSRADLKTRSDRRNLARTFLSQGHPVFVLGVHLCGTLSLRALEIFNDAPCCTHLALKPCCLPIMLHARRCEVFEVGNHSFPACHVCVDGRWRRNQWVGRTPADDAERKFHRWADHLGLGVLPHGGKVSVEKHVVQRGWFQNSFVFCSRPFRDALPASVIAYREGTESDGGGTNAAPSAEQKAAWEAQLRAERAKMKAERRAARRVAPADDATTSSGGAAVASGQSEPATAAEPACPECSDEW